MDTGSSVPALFLHEMVKNIKSITANLENHAILSALNLNSHIVVGSLVSAKDLSNPLLKLNKSILKISQNEGISAIYITPVSVYPRNPSNKPHQLVVPVAMTLMPAPHGFFSNLDFVDE